MTGQRGTPRWAAPELFELERAQQSSGASSDIYSYGIILYELLTLSEPWSEVSGYAAWRKVSQGERPRVTEAQRRESPSEFFELMTSCWSQEPSERPTARTVVQKLADILRRSEQQNQNT